MSPTLDSASLSFSDLTTGWEERRARFLELTDAVWRVRGYGDFWSYCLLAEGAVDVVAEPEVKVWDLAPLDIVIREAGGRFTNIDGSPGPHGGSAVATNGLLHDDVLGWLAGTGKGREIPVYPGAVFSSVPSREEVHDPRRCRLTGLGAAIVAPAAVADPRVSVPFVPVSVPLRPAERREWLETQLGNVTLVTHFPYLTPE